jgi:nucleoid-associated protein YgaU
MVKSFRLGLGILCAIALTGCSTKTVSVKDMTVKGYIQDRERVDQDENGNAGFLMGKAPALEPIKKTRKVYVVEVTKTPNYDVVKKTTSKAPVVTTTVMQESKEESQKAQEVTERINLPQNGEAIKTQEPSSLTQTMNAGDVKEYVIEKDDTLQKISKKFYDSYSKWPKIYEANKDVIKDPNHIPSGKKIVIPPLQ